MSIKQDGKTYYEEGEIALLRREADKDLKETLQWIVKDLQDNAKAFVAVRQGLDQATKMLEKHQDILYGNGKEGVLVLIGKMGDILSRLDKSINDTDSGIVALHMTVKELKDESEDWKQTSKDMSNMKLKITLITTLIAMIVSSLFPKGAEIIRSLLGM